jgi:hypothetical protein
MVSESNGYDVGENVNHTHQILRKSECCVTCVLYVCTYAHAYVCVHVCVCVCVSVRVR